MVLGDLDLPVLTPGDVSNLQAVADDAETLVQALRAAGSQAGIILKIENRQAFGPLPALLPAALARTGVPTRAEVTDAAMSGRAEAEMLDKGPFVPEAIAVLDDVLAADPSEQEDRHAQAASGLG